MMNLHHPQHQSNFHEQHTPFAAPIPNGHHNNHVCLHNNNNNNNSQYTWSYTSQRNSADQSLSEFNSSSMTHGSNQSVYHHNQHMDDSEMMMDEQDYSQYQMGFPEEDEMVEGMMTPRAVHQCNVCNKIFVSYKGLQQHAVIHTDQKPFRCDICSKSFRFKSNLFEHRSVHTGFTPHACPYCGKTCRLKGNLKKHLRTHVTTKEELEAAWRPFARFDLNKNGTPVLAKSRFSNRRPPADIPDDAIVLRGAGGPYYTPPPRPKKKKLGLGEPEHWVDKLRRGDLLPQVELEDKIRRLEDTIFNNMSLERWGNLFEIAKSIAFETHDCPVCKSQFMTRMDCVSHHTLEHENHREGLEFFCEKCYRPFADEASYNQHMSYHTRVSSLIETGEIVPQPADPEILVPTNDEFQMLFGANFGQQMMEPQLI